jgi:hypothetical protein
MSVYGTHYLGKINVVPGLFHVATKFFHINFVPLVPLGSAIVFANSDHTMANGQLGILAVKLPFNWPSFFMAYLRTILWICLLASIIFFAVNLIPAPKNVTAANFYGFSGLNLLSANALAVAVSCALLYWSHRASVAGRERALELAQLAGFNEQVVLEQLAFDGSPLRKPAKAFGLRNCKACGTLNRGMTSEDGTMICGRCSAVIARKGGQSVGIWLFLLLLAMGAAAAYYFGKH